MRLPFTVEAPRVDETPWPTETPRQTAHRLSLDKANEVAERHFDAVVIGSDQVADLDGRAIGKPGSHERAAMQLRQMSGRAVVFHTGVAVVCRAIGFVAAVVVPVTVRFRELNDREITRYLDLDRPYDCAGSAKSEALGIVLIDAIESDDATALIGLPLIRTCAMLRDAGIDPLGGDVDDAGAGS